MSEPFVGQIQPFGFNFAPRGWAKCEGHRKLYHNDNRGQSAALSEQD
ncbi:MAG: hypothetical protein GTO45_31200 [Candidatus Aminicenantes bacterium]|nr:hypothetical protein [Candidatus Aminicenantes bacterium]NIM83266.1 hypothetical protein [Candidatus Aminicenantes bacterium]NIN22637.1 hypothetical protein [Candidatus Aminicenantes bacterium]NIN46396.1 hypothetical protein [Candidatus Aminicenantes bacterium]NIN89246.1 hypothetical protein [Candidatus Aminicenantes bacterium]